MLKLVYYDNPLLHRKITRSVSHAELQEYLPEFLDVMIENHGIGLAANQVGIDGRFFAIMLDEMMYEEVHNYMHKDKTVGPNGELPIYFYRGMHFLVVLDPVVWFDANIFHKSTEIPSYEVVEGCLSIPRLKDVRKVLPVLPEPEKRNYVKNLVNNRPGFRVQRINALGIYFKDMSGNKVELMTSGLLAQVIQHEYDHLNGITIADRCAELIQRFRKWVR